MSKKKFNSFSALVYSTDPNYQPPEENNESPETATPDKQIIKIQLDKKQRAGKIVTLIFGFEDTDESIEALGKEIKRFCGTGGSVKDREIILQGDFREKALQWLKKKGYIKTRVI